MCQAMYSFLPRFFFPKEGFCRGGFNEASLLLIKYLRSFYIVLQLDYFSHTLMLFLLSQGLWQPR